jgi:2-aminobenzoate-CoA ligase
MWPEFLLDGFDYPDRLNAAVELTDRMVEKGFGDHTALIGNGRRRTYKELADWTNRLAHVAGRGSRGEARQPGADPVRQQSGDGGLLAGCDQGGCGGGQHHADAARGELSKIVDKAEIEFALCDTRLMDEMVACAKTSARISKKSSASTAPPITMRSWTGWR